MDRRLPDEMLRNISSFLTPADMSSFSRTSTTVRDIYNPAFFNIETYMDPNTEIGRLFKTTYDELTVAINVLKGTLDAMGSTNVEPSEIDLIQWIVKNLVSDIIDKRLKDIFKDSPKVHRNKIATELMYYFDSGIIPQITIIRNTVLRVSRANKKRVEFSGDIIEADLDTKGVIPALAIAYRAKIQFRRDEDDGERIINEAVHNFNRECKKFKDMVINAMGAILPSGTSREAYRMRRSTRKTKRSVRKSVRKSAKKTKRSVRKSVRKTKTSKRR